MNENNFDNMNNQPDNNAAGSDENSSQYSDINMSQGVNQTQNNNNQGFNYTYDNNGQSAYSQPTGGSAYSQADQSSQNYSQAYNGYNQYSYYPAPQYTPVKKKPRKKRGFVRVAQFTAGAVLFGLIAGGVTIGTDYFFHPANNGIQSEVIKEDPITVTTSNNNSSTVPTSSSSDSIVSDVSGVVDKVMPSIVAINSSSTMTNYDFFGNQFSQPVQGSGSGIIIGQDDKNTNILIMTNNHVIEGATSVQIVFSDGKTANATVKGADSRSDLALLIVKMSDLSQDTLNTIKVANLGDSTKIKAGEMAIAIGNALGYGQSVTVGYISAINRQVDVDGTKVNLLQTDAAINPGNSGGALLDTNGNVIGINSLKFASTDVEGMGYAIPISDAIPIINDLMNRQTVSASEKGYLGINLQTAQNVTDVYAQQYNMPMGVYVNDVIAGSPAEKAGLKSGNIIIGFNNLKIETTDDLVNAMSYAKAGDSVTLKVSVLESGKYTEKNLNVVLGKAPNN